MTKNQERHIIASVGTAIFMLIVFLLLWFIYLTAVVPEEEEGVEIAFGEVAEAGGYMAEQSEAVPMPAPEPATPVQPSSPAEEEILTSEEQEALALAEAKKKREAEEKARLEAERKAREAAEAERKAKEAEAVAKANAFGALFGQSGNTTGSGDSQGAGQKGNPVGHGSVGGNSWSLSGRGIKGNFPIPEKGKYSPGKVVIMIIVDPQGKVVDAREAAGGNISDRATIEAMLKKAREVQFTTTDSKTNQRGYITYIIPD